MAVGILAKLFALVFTVTYALLGGTMVSLALLVRVIRKGPKKVFSCKVRDTMPECMKNPELGSHAYIRTKAQSTDYLRNAYQGRISQNSVKLRHFLCGDVRLHYVAAGDETKPLMLFVHGFPECWYSWRYQITEFKKDYRVVAIDQRAYGDSDTPRGVANYSVKKLVGDIKDVISGLGYNSCTLVAHDWGGAVAWNVAASYPDIVDKLIVMNIPHPRTMMDHFSSGNVKQILSSWYIFFFQLPFLPEINCWAGDYAMVKLAFHSDGMGLKNKENITEEDVEAFKYSASQKGNLTGMINYYRAAMRYPSGIKSSMSTPTLIIWGDQDKALSIKLLEGTEKYVKDLTIKIVAGASHWVQQDAPDVVNQHMRAFLKGN